MGTKSEKFQEKQKEREKGEEKGNEEEEEIGSEEKSHGLVTIKVMFFFLKLKKF